MQQLKPNDKIVIRTLLSEEGTYATVLLLLLVDKYGQEVLQWAPETIKEEVRADFAVKLSKQALDKIMAAIAIVTTNYFYKDVLRFVELVNILSGDDAQPEEFDPATAAQVLRDEGYMNAPDLLAVTGYDGSDFVRDTWSDDPEMYQAIYEVQQQKAEHLKESLKENFHDLFTQLRLLPIAAGNKEDIMQRIVSTESQV
jgi:hypothetical protein